MKIRKTIKVVAEVDVCGDWCGSCDHFDDYWRRCRLFNNEGLGLAFDFTCNEYVPIRCLECVNKFGTDEESEI